ncbi:hypothetical protein vseg_011345 [Gypsophila vaccaria]
MKEEEFRERVKKTFGNLLTTTTNQQWTLTGGHVERRHWRRDVDPTDRDNNPCASSFVENDDNDWDLRASIGLDSTLDHEDEEDAYDKVAIGREDTGDRLYMGVVANKNAPKFISSDDLSSISGSLKRDPRANRLAAKIRLKEDDAEAGQQTTAQVPPASAEKLSVPSSGDVVDVKPILKRKEHEHESTSKPSKRVRFDPEYVNEGSASSRAKENMSANIPSDNTASADQSVLDERVRRVPDYARNPSKYTCYSFDSTDEVSDKSNIASCLDILRMVKNLQDSESQSEQEDALPVPPKSIVFIPKKKSDSAKAGAAHCESTRSTVVPGFLNEDVEETEVADMEVDTSRKHERQYRTKSQADEPE